MLTMTIWGARGSLPLFNENTNQYSCNTSCVSIQADDKLIIFDAGTGIVNLGDKIIKTKQNFDADIFLTHYHYDHILGFLSFKPIFYKKSKIRLYGEDKHDMNLEQILNQFMKPPFFPLSFNKLASDITFNKIIHDKAVIIKTSCGDDIKITPKPTIHPDGNVAYKLEFKNKSIVYLTDFAHYDSEHDSIVEYVKECDILMYDANFTEEEYNSKQYAGWGHSCYEKATKLSKLANVKKLILFHHKIDRTDAELESMLENSRKAFKNTFIAKEGDVYELL